MVVWLGLWNPGQRIKRNRSETALSADASSDKVVWNQCFEETETPRRATAMLC